MHLIILDGILKDDQLVCKQTGEVIKESQLYGMRFDGFTVDVILYNLTWEGDKQKVLNTFDSMWEAVFFMEDHPLNEGETLKMQLNVGGEPVDNTGVLEKIKTFLQNNLE